MSFRSRFCLAIICCGVRSAEAAEERLTWWVDDELAAVELSQALEALWPAHPVQVELGRPSGSQEGIFFQSPELVLFAAGRVWRESTGEDAAAQVALARSWIRDIRLTDGGWAPEVATPEVPAAPEPPATPPALRSVQGWALAGVGGAVRPGGRVALHGAGQLGLSFNRYVGVTLVTSWDLFEGVNLADPLSINRGSAMFGLTGHVGADAGVSLTVAGGTRFGDVLYREDDNTLARVWMPTACLRLHGWGPPTSQQLRFGGGVGIDVDSTSLLGFHGFPMQGGSRLGIHAEVGILFGAPFSQREIP